MSKGTTHRSIRVDSELWEAVRIAADKRGDNLSVILRDALRQYIEESETE